MIIFLDFINILIEKYPPKNFNHLFSFPYDLFYKERFEYSKLYLELKIKCKFETGLTSKKFKLK